MEERKNGLVNAFQKSVTAGMAAFLLANGAMAATGPELTPAQQREVVAARYDKLVAAVKEHGAQDKKPCYSTFLQREQEIKNSGVDVLYAASLSASNRKATTACLDNFKAIEGRAISLVEKDKLRDLAKTDAAKPPKPKS